ncbi:CGNR zinc finger domain-containing protein [Allokutzneria sp. A3M-2-11 16]|uniref:CGNR zinc finger domain-containing protein n=1 Tax=Allokutzneria sp. A3M-2-11 16 TaxID=2962043 RepID=UPI0020B7B1A0|nr:CGNR zinc finger domain-containing protein [Allokutzneria sp. A3M-2-11 16]MCP3805115.1 CGNR zinc finger domain-containing protein [Allokutzneria sp. A3M-2-11 16]
MEYPILGTEPLPVEFANTLYGGLDCLGTPELAAGWFAAMELEAAEPDRARELRDAVYRLLTEQSELDPDAVQTLNAFAAEVPSVLRLDSDGKARWVTTTSAVLGRIATCAIELLVDGVVPRRCAAPDCGVLFVAQHGRRRFCHPSCSGRMRQARYYRRHLKEQA